MADKSNSLQTIRRVTQTMPGRNTDPQVAQHPADRYVRIMRELMDQKLQASTTTLDSLTDVNVPAPSNNQVLTWVAADAEWEAVTPAASGDSTFTAAEASRPAPSNDGDLFLPSDGYQIERDTGAAWVPWGPIFPLTAPVPGDFSFISDDGGAATATTTKGGITLSEAFYSGAGHNGVVYTKSAPGTPYLIHTCILHSNLIAIGSSYETGLIAVDSVNSLGVSFYLNSSSNLIAVGKESGGTGWAGGATYYTAAARAINWFGMGDDGTNLRFYVSGDGQNWTRVFTSPRHDWLTAGPDKVGLFMRTLDLSGTALDTGYMTLISWKQL